MTGRAAAFVDQLVTNGPPTSAGQGTRRLGHSVDVLIRVYAGVFDDQRERSNRLIDEALRAQPRVDQCQR